MSTITLPNIRVSSDLTVKLKLKDGGVALDWSTLQNIKVSIYSDAQRALAGRCSVAIDAEDSTLLVCTYAANKPQYVGVNRVVVSAKYMNETKTYDKPAFNFVRWTDDQEGQTITIDDPDIDVEISVEDVSSSILQEAVDAANTAAERANEAAEAAEHMVDIHTGPAGKSAYEVAVEEGYTGTEEEWLASLVGPQGPQGIQGETGEAAGFGTVSATLTEDGGNPGVTVAASGSDTAKQFAFTFKNLKGEKGDKGDQGNSGYTGAAGELEVVNNLTDGGAAKALSAEMGKTLEGEVSQLEHKVDDVLDITEYTETINVPYTTTNQYIANYNPPEFRDNANYRLSNLIHFEKGDKVIYTGSTGSSAVVLVARFENNVWTKLLVGNTSMPTQTLEYLVEDESGADIYFCWYKTPDVVIKRERKHIHSVIDDLPDFDTLDQTVQRLDTEVGTIDEILDVETNTVTTTKELVDNVDFTPQAGYIGSGGGSITGTSSLDFKNTGDIHLLAGDIVSIRVGGPDSVSIIAKKATETTYTSIEVGSGWNLYKNATYTATEECDVLVSYQVSNNMTHKIEVTRTRDITDSQRLLAIEESTDAIPVLQESVDEMEENIITTVEDDLTEDVLTGFVKNDGTVDTNSDYGHKEFSVRAGSVIVAKSNYGIPTMAFLARKIPVDTGTVVKYETLFVSSNYTAQEETYTAPEDIVIAISFKLTWTKSIKITTNAIQSHTANIDILLDAKNRAFIQDIDFGFMFNRIAVIGDSLASGRVEGIVGQSDAQGADYYGFSWLSFLAKRWRCDRYVNYSRGGQHTSDWITEWLPVMQADPTVYDAYFIALGTNNEYNETNPSGDQTNYDAFIERYNSIIDDVRTKAPNAVIFLVSLYEKRPGVGNATLEEIAEERMATDKGIYYIDYANTADYHRYSPDVNWRWHFSSTGYAYVASVINQIVNRIVWENQTEEFWRQFAKYHNINNDMGTTATRPSASAVGVGFTYYDKTLGKMIMSNGTAWVNMDGTALS